MKKQHLFLSSLLLCGCFCLAFTFDAKGIYWLWADNKPVAITLAIATIILGVLWVKSAGILLFKRKQ